MNEPMFEMDGEAEPEEDMLGVLPDDEVDEDAVVKAAAEAAESIPEPEAEAEPPAIADSSIEFDEDIADVAAAADETPEPEPEPPPPPPPSWAELLDDAIYLARARCAVSIDGSGNVQEFRGDWPKNTLDKVAARLLRAMEQAPPPPSPGASQFVEIQLGSFWLTGLKVGAGAKAAVVGFLSQAPIKREVRPGIEAEVRRAIPR
jgi:hypothetical protein